MVEHAFLLLILWFAGEPRTIRIRDIVSSRSCVTQRKRRESLVKNSSTMVTILAAVRPFQTLVARRFCGTLQRIGNRRSGGPTGSAKKSFSAKTSLASLLPSGARMRFVFRILVVVGVSLSLLAPTPLLVLRSSVAAQCSGGPSAFCHITDGIFTDCDPQNPGGEEWSDVQATPFPAANSVLYVSQNAARSALFLMYDFPFHTTPIASSQAVRVSFDTVEDDESGAKLGRYDVDIFGDGRVEVFVFGNPVPPNGIVGAIGFAPSPNSPIPHLMAELQVPLIPGGATVYSPDPLFWSVSVPPPPPPPKQGRFTQEQKEALNKAAAELNLEAAIGAAVAAACLAIPDPSVTKICAFAAGLTSGLLWIASALFGRLALDPSDPNFTVIAQPVTPSLSQQPIPAGEGITQQQADAMNTLFTNLGQAIGLARAIQTSIDRAQGARDANNAFWEGEQLQAARQFALQLSTLIAAQPGLLANLQSALQAAGFQPTFTQTSVADFQSAVELGGFPPLLAQAFTELGADSALRDEIRQSLLTANSVDIAALGAGSFPQSLTDPSLTAALERLASSLNDFGQPPASGLKPSLNVTIAGDYTAAGVGLRDRTQGDILLSGIPAGASVVQAFLYWGMLDNGESASLKNLNFNGTPLTGAKIATGPDTCWGRTNSFAFRADVTSLVPGNGTYSLTGVAGGGAILAEGASLVVLYEKLGEPLRNVILMDGNVVFPQVLTGTTTFSGFLAADPASAKTTFVVGDGQVFSDTASFSGSAGNTLFSNPFNGSDGPLWDTDTFDVSLQVGSGNAPASAGISIGSDCLMWVAQVFSVKTPPSEAVADVRASAAVVEANENGCTTVDPVGLFPINEPSLGDKVFLVVRDRLEENPNTPVATLTQQLVNSLVEGGLLPADEADDVINSVLQRLVTPVNIDIKPGSFPNSINLGSRGVVPVAIISTTAFDARTVDPITVTLAGAQVRLRGNGTAMASFEDIDGDGLLDLVVHVSTQALQLSGGDIEAILEGQTFGGTRIRGVDSVRIVP